MTHCCCDARPDLLYLLHDLWPWGKPHEAARVHHVARRRGGVAARGSRAAGGRENSYDRCPGDRALAAHRQPQAVRLKLTAGPKFDFDVIASTSLATGTVAVIEAASFVGGFGSTAEFSTSKVGVIHSEDMSPTDVTGGTPSPASPVKSLFQTDAIGLKTTLWASWGLRAAGHAQWLQGATW